ncbi:hypothetical protein CAEBREN_04228 [Caenorhabditis brenneri]|uniref:Uncharacterized protein n=1 Tax=Caenorhabditis brenneri TaxID=135651 RepID=G0P399_CAEBE|nr:hypothetical protein CAEBREN_04228 [Caenorhabditis brenneri]
MAEEDEAFYQKSSSSSKRKGQQQQEIRSAKNRGPCQLDKKSFGWRPGCGLDEANNAIDSLQKRSKHGSMEYKKEKEEMKNIHKTQLNELNTKITELSENVGALKKNVEAKDIEISALKTKAETLDGIQKLLQGSVPSKENVVTPKKECVHNDVETHNKENTEEKSEVVTAEEVNAKPIRKRKGEKTKSGDKKQPKL